MPKYFFRTTTCLLHHFAVNILDAYPKMYQGCKVGLLHHGESKKGRQLSRALLAPPDRGGAEGDLA